VPVPKSKSLLTRRELLTSASVATIGSHIASSSRASSQSTTDDPLADEIWDAHGHFMGLRGTPEQRVDTILRHADRMGIAKLMICMGLKFNADPTPDEMQRDNDAVLSAVAHAPDRVLGFVYLNPKHVVASLNELDRCVKNGPMVGVKLWLAMRCNHPDLDAIVRRANDLGVPILQHVYQRTLQNREGESSPLDLSELAHRHPKATFIAAHTGNDWEQGIRAIRANKNVYCEICGSDPTAGMVEMAVRELGAQRVLYGSDIDGRSFASQLAKVTGANITAQKKSLILAGNLKRVLAPILAKQGPLR
jgi:predicted TIM-barrel fold metal-dependent hydrolase